MSLFPSVGQFSELLHQNEDEVDEMLNSLHGYDEITAKATMTPSITQNIVKHVLNMASKGLQEYEVVSFYHIFLKLLQHMKENNLSSTLQQTENLFKLAIVNKEFRTKSLPAAYHFLQKTLFQHFHLYKHFILYERAVDQRLVTLNLDTPTFSTYPMNEAVTEKVWTYMNTYNRIQEDENLRKAQLKQEKEEKLRIISTFRPSSLIDDSFSVTEGQDPKEYKKVVDEIVQQVIEKNVELTRLSIESQLQGSLIEIECSLDRTALPRPQVLGPPPRFKTKPVLKPPKEKTNTSKKSPGSSRGNSANENKRESQTAASGKKKQ